MEAKKPQQSNVRLLKVYERHFSRSYFRFKSFPEIRLCGKWLSNFGFNHGNKILVEIDESKIVITLEVAK